MDFLSGPAAASTRPPPHCGRCDRCLQTSGQPRLGSARGRRAPRAEAAGSWAGSNGRGHPPPPRRSWGRGWMAVGLGGQRRRQSHPLCSQSNRKEAKAARRSDGHAISERQNTDQRLHHLHLHPHHLHHHHAGLGLARQETGSRRKAVTMVTKGATKAQAFDPHPPPHVHQRVSQIPAGGEHM